MVRGTSPRSPLASMEPSSRASSVHSMGWPSGSLASIVKDTSCGAWHAVREATRVACGGWLPEGGGGAVLVAEVLLLAEVLLAEVLVAEVVGGFVVVLELPGLPVGLGGLVLGLVDDEGPLVVPLDELEAA